MAPKRKQSNENGTANPAAAVSSTRVTRSSIRRANTTQPVADPEPPKKKRAKATASAAAAKKEAENTLPPAAESKVLDTSKTIVIEHCKQCNSFKTRALQVKSGLEKGVVGVNVLVNPEKPRRGCFEIREEGGEIFVSLLDLKRPFIQMKALEMEKVISDIIEKIR